MHLSLSIAAKVESFSPFLPSFQKWQEEVTAYRDEVEGVGTRAQEILDESHVGSRLGCQATQLTSRYQALLLQVLVSGHRWPKAGPKLCKPSHSFHYMYWYTNKDPIQGFNTCSTLFFAYQGTSKILGGRDPEFGGIGIIAQFLF